jgi:hypothetical protein
VAYSPRSRSKIQAETQDLRSDQAVADVSDGTSATRTRHGITIYVRAPYMVRLRTSTGELARSLPRFNSGR